MSDKEKIRAEIERRKKYNKEHENDWAGTSHFWQRKEDEEILSFIDSMQEEPMIPDIVDEHWWEMLGEEPVNNGLDLGCGVIWKDEEPVSEDLEEAANNALNNVLNTHEIVNVRSCLEMFRFGAKWQKQQFEKNRLKHCNSITNEQAELEQGFIDQHLDKHQRMPTYLDAIEYGMNLQKEQMIDKLRKWIASKNERDSFTFGYIDRHFDELLKQAMKDE